MSLNILITGGAGFVGSSLCLQLKARNPAYKIVALDNLKRRGSELNLLGLKTAGIDFIHGDIRCREDIEQSGPFDAMIEASAEPSVMAGLTGNPYYVINNNLYGVVHCLEQCIKQQSHLIFLSTSRVYPINRIERANYQETDTRFVLVDDQCEPGLSKAGISEKLPLDGARSFYGATKLAAELFIEEYAAFYGLPASVIRYGVIAGPRQMGKTDQGVAALWMASHYWKKTLAYIGYGGSGKQVRDILHIDDLVDLVDLQLHRPELFTGKVFNAGGGMAGSLSLMEMTTLCERITGNAITINRIPENRPADLRYYVSDHSKLTEETGWRPNHGPERIFCDIFNWIKENEATLNPFFA